jgi:hypothetical protein
MGRGEIWAVELIKLLTHLRPNGTASAIAKVVSFGK